MGSIKDSSGHKSCKCNSSLTDEPMSDKTLHRYTTWGCAWRSTCIIQIKNNI